MRVNGVESADERETRSLDYLRRVVSALSAGEATVLYGSAFAVEFLLFGAIFAAIAFLPEDGHGLAPVLIGRRDRRRGDLAGRRAGGRPPAFLATR